MGPRSLPQFLLLALLATGVAAQQPRPTEPPPGSAQPQEPQQPQPQQPAAGQAQPSEQQDQQQPRPPVIRRGINFIRVDVIATDKNGRPVLDLKPEDFEILEEGKPQKIETFQVINVGSEPAHTATPIRNQADIEREAQREDVRVIAILLDDYHVRRGAAMGVREPLERFLQQQVAPTDLVGIMYPLTPVSDFNLTRNHDALVSAVRNFEGRKYDYTPRNEFEERYAYYPAVVVERIRNEVTLTALKALVTHLGGVREGRKAVILVSEGFTNNLPPQLNDPIAAMPGLGNPNRGNAALDPEFSSHEFFREMDILTELREVYAAANRSNTAIYTLDPRGLSAFEYDINEGVGANFDRRIANQTRDTLMVLASETDGRAIINRNDLDAGLRQIIRDSSGYYLIGYNSTESPTDGKFHEIKVRIRRPGVQVRARKGYWAYTAEDAARATEAANRPTTSTVPPEVEQALASMASPRGRRARTWVGTSRADSGKTMVTFSWEPTPAAAGPGSIQGPDPEQVSLTALAPSGQPLFRGKVPARSAVTFEAAPGPLQLRYNIETAEGRLVDSDTREVTVPDYSAPEVRLSTPKVFRGRTPRDMQAARNDPNAAPTAAREFSRAERLLIRVDAYGPGKQPPAMTAKLLNRAGKPMVDIPVKPRSDAPGSFDMELPLASLAHGDYLIELTATPAGDGGAGGARELVAIRVTS